MLSSKRTVAFVTTLIAVPSVAYASPHGGEGAVLIAILCGTLVVCLSIIGLFSAARVAGRLWRGEKLTAWHKAQALFVPHLFLVIAAADALLLKRHSVAASSIQLVAAVVLLVFIVAAARGSWAQLVQARSLLKPIPVFCVAFWALAIVQVNETQRVPRNHDDIACEHLGGIHAESIPELRVREPHHPTHVTSAHYYDGPESSVHLVGTEGRNSGVFLLRNEEVIAYWVKSLFIVDTLITPGGTLVAVWTKPRRHHGHEVLVQIFDDHLNVAHSRTLYVNRFRPTIGFEEGMLCIADGSGLILLDDELEPWGSTFRRLKHWLSHGSLIPIGASPRRRSFRGSSQKDFGAAR